jgi:hypothetical protein
MIFDQEIRVGNPSDGSLYTIQGLQPNEANHTLGVLLSPDGDGSSQVQHSIRKAKEFFSKFINAALSQKVKMGSNYLHN